MALSFCIEVQSVCNAPARVPFGGFSERTVLQCTCNTGALFYADGRSVRFPPPPPFFITATLCSYGGCDFCFGTYCLLVLFSQAKQPRLPSRQQQQGGLLGHGHRRSWSTRGRAWASLTVTPLSITRLIYALRMAWKSILPPGPCFGIPAEVRSWSTLRAVCEGT